MSEPFRFKVTGFTGSVAQYDAAGTTTMVATNGDKLFGAVTGSGSNNVVTGDGSGTNTVVITGGTGRFAYAIGTRHRVLHELWPGGAAGNHARTAQPREAGQSHQLEKPSPA